MWPVSGVHYPKDWFDLRPIRVLYDFEFPRIFTCEDKADDYHLAYFCGEDATGLRFLVVPFSPASENQLTRGDIDLYDALAKNRAWVIDVDNHWNQKHVLRVDFNSLPADVLPRPGVMLYAHLPRVTRRWNTYSSADNVTWIWKTHQSKDVVFANA
jgi:hypothetical protein